MTAFDPVVDVAAVQRSAGPVHAGTQSGQIHLSSGELDVLVAVDGPPVGFVAIALNAYHPQMGAVQRIG